MTRFWIVLLVVGMWGAGPSSPVAAQDLRAGFTLGFSTTTLHTEVEGPDRSYRTGFLAGLMADVGLPGPLGARGELLFSQKGVKVAAEDGDINYEAAYLEMPLLLTVRLPFLQAYSAHLVAGPAVALKIFERQAATGDNINVGLNVNETFYTRTDASFVVGLGGNIGAGPGALGLQLRYMRGLTDAAQSIEQQPFPNSPFPEDGRHGVIALMLSFGF